MIEVTNIPNAIPGIYRICCDKSGMVYVGQSNNIRRRVREHILGLTKGKHRNKQMQSEYDTYGPDSFNVEIIRVSFENLDELEMEYIDQARKENKCYNVFGGGKTGFTVTQEFRDKISRAHKGRKLSDETKKLMSQNAKKQWENQEYRDLMIGSAKNQWKDEDYRRIMHSAHTGKSDACGHKLNAADVLEMRSRYSNGESASKLAEEFGVKYCAAKAAISGRSWKNI